MKNKTIKLFATIVVLGCAAAVFMAIPRRPGLSNHGFLKNEVWTFQAGEPIITTPILIDDQIIFRTVNKIYSISAMNGSMNWETASKADGAKSETRKPLIGNSKYLISIEQNNSIGIYAPKTGSRLWAVEGQVNFIADIKIVDDIMIVATHDSNLAVYDLSTYQMLWEVPLPPRSGTPIEANTASIILGTRDGLHVYSLNDGRLLNEKPYNTSLIGEIALNKADIFVSHAREGGDWTISSLQLDSLEENWTFHVGKITHPYFSVSTDYLSLYNKTLLLLDVHTGDVIWRDNAQDFYSEPALNNNNLFFVAKQGKLDTNLCRVDIQKDTTEECLTIEKTWTFFNPQLLGPLTINDLLVITRNSEVFAFPIP